MNHLAPPLVGLDLGDLIPFAAILLFFIIPLIGRLLAKIQKMQPPPAGGPRPARPVPADVADEIDEFMRRVAKRPSARSGRPTHTPKPQPPVEEPVRAEVVGQQPVGGRVGQHVKKHLNEEGFRRRGDRLGSEVASADDQIEQRLHQVFDHQMGQLEKAPRETSTPPVAAESFEADAGSPEVPAASVAGLFDLIANPESLRQAIILSEVFHRPEERWR